MSRFKKLMDQVEASKEPKKDESKTPTQSEKYKKAEEGFKKRAEGPEWFKKVRKFISGEK